MDGRGVDMSKVVRRRVQWKSEGAGRRYVRPNAAVSRRDSVTLGARVPGFQWEHAEYIAGIETLCPAFAQQEHPVHIQNAIWVCAPNVPIGNILFTAGMKPCHVSKMYSPGTFQMLSTHVHKMFPAYAQWACCGYMHFVWMFSAFSSIFWCTFKMLFKMN
jgi:hypothetical protein